MSVAALDQVLTESQVPQRPLNGATIEVGSALSETTAAGALFSKNLTESQFFERYPEWKGKLTLAHKALVELTGKVLEANSHPMNRAVHDFISWAAAIYSADQKIPQREIQLMFEGLDGHLQTIKEAAPSNVDAVVFKAMQTIRSLWREMEQKNLVSHNPEILLYLSSRLKTGAPEPFQTVEELGLDSAAVSKEPEGWSVSLSAVLKVGLAAGAVLAGYYFYSTGMLTRVLSALQERGKAPDSELASLSNEFQYSAAIDQRLLHEVALTPNVVPLLVKGKADLWKRASDDSESCLLRVASSVAGKPGNEFVDDETFVALFRSGLETHSQSPNYMTADDATYAMNDLLTQGRVGVFEKLGGADVEKLLQRITPQNRLLLWTASKDHPKISEILEKAGAYLPLVEEFETSETLSEILIEWMMKDERLIHKLVECKADLLKTGPDRNPLLVEYVRYNPFPRWDTYHLMKDSAQWASDIEEKVRAAAYRTKKFDFLNKLF